MRLLNSKRARVAFQRAFPAEVKVECQVAISPSAHDSEETPHGRVYPCSSSHDCWRDSIAASTWLHLCRELGLGAEEVSAEAAATSAIKMQSIMLLSDVEAVVDNAQIADSLDR